MKKILSVIFFLVICTVNVSAFSDVEGESELGLAVAALEAEGVINGYEDGSFRPEMPVTRAQLCKMINVLFNFTDIGSNDFWDVSYTDWYYMHVLTASAYEYISGYEDASFRGQNTVTREQACVIINRITPLLEIEESVSIKDPVSDWARDAVQTVANHGLLTTDENGNFRAGENITRGELSMLLSRFIPKEKSDTAQEGKTGTDAEIAIENAVVLANLKAAVRDIKKVSFRENEQEIINCTLQGLEGTIEAGLSGTLINKRYVVVNYGKQITKARDLYKAMSEDEKANFHGNLVRLSNSTLIFLQSYFLGDKPPV